MRRGRGLVDHGVGLERWPVVELAEVVAVQDIEDALLAARREVRRVGDQHHASGA